MDNLKDYVEHLNWQRRTFWNLPPLSLDNAEDRAQMRSNLESALSPENLTCDGELSAAQVRVRYRQLTRLQEELIRIGSRVS
jgi:hypothetical protein